MSQKSKSDRNSDRKCAKGWKQRPKKFDAQKRRLVTVSS